MHLPRKALRFSQFLEEKGTDDTVPRSGHKVEKKRFIDSAGERITVYFKPVGETYPATLAMYCGGISEWLREFIDPEKVAEEVLVFDDNDQIIGTASYEIKGLTTLLPSGKKSPKNPIKKELVDPSTETLIRNNNALFLAAHVLLSNDDVHPGNYSQFAMFDYDMFLYYLTWIMKGGRWVHGVFKPTPEKAMHLKKPDIDNFPINECATHYVTKDYPDNYNPYKKHKAYEAFRALASNPSVEIAAEEDAVEKDGVQVCFQEQMFDAFLRYLALYDPQTFKVRLEDYFGDLPLNYTSMGAYKSEQISKAAPLLFNSVTNREPFVEHFLRLAQLKYDENYSLLVFYRGCEKNIANVPVPAFAQFLRNKPSAIKKIIAWAEGQNQLMKASWEKHLEKEGGLELVDLKQAPPQDRPPLDRYCVPEAGRFNIDTILKRYHQIWRDSHLTYIQQTIADANRLATALYNALSLKKLPEKQTLVDPTDPKYKSSYAILKDTPMLNSSLRVDCDKENVLKHALDLMKEFNIRLKQICEKYYQLQVKDNNLHDVDNEIFCMELQKLVNTYKESIPKLLTPETPWSKDFEKIIANLQTYYCGMDIAVHLDEKNTDKALGTKDPDYPSLINRPHTEKEVVAACMRALFDWANAIDKKVLIAYIEEVIRVRYAPYALNLTANRVRGEFVQNYLKTSNEDGANILGHILSIGGQESTSLNTWIVHDLINLMSQATLGRVEVNLWSIREAFDQKKFDSLTYASKAAIYAKTNDRFEHLYSKKSMQILNDAMYEWVQFLPKKTFQEIVKSALGKYKPYKFNIFRESRAIEVNGYFDPKKNNSNEHILALIFCRGGIDDTSLNPKLFRRIILCMKQDTSLRYNDEYKILQEIGEDNENAFLAVLAKYAKDKLHSLEVDHSQTLVRPIFSTETNGRKGLNPN